MDIGTDKSKEKRAEHHVFAELLNHGVLPYRTAGGGLWLNTPAGCRLELRAVLRQAQDERLGNGEGEECRFVRRRLPTAPGAFLPLRRVRRRRNRGRMGVAVHVVFRVFDP